MLDCLSSFVLNSILKVHCCITSICQTAISLQSIGILYVSALIVHFSLNNYSLLTIHY